MNHIELFNKQKQEEVIQNTSRLQQKRPQKINLSKVISQNQKWRQCKIIGKNISIRSYSSSCVYQNKFYVYGGYQILNGLMADFYYINVDDNIDKYNWIQVLPKNQNLPGPRAKHSMVSTKDKIYLIAGLHSDVQSSNQIFSFDPKISKWQVIKPVGQVLPKLDSFGCALVQNQGQESIIIMCGYNGQRFEYSNAVYQYNIKKIKYLSFLKVQMLLTKVKVFLYRLSNQKKWMCCVYRWKSSLYVWWQKLRYQNE